MALPLAAALAPLLTQALPTLLPTLATAFVGPLGQAAQGILGQLAQNVFSESGKGGLFTDTLKLNLPNPLSVLNGPLAQIGKGYSSAGDLLKDYGNFLQGKPKQLENGVSVSKPHILKSNTAKVHHDWMAKMAAQPNITVNIHLNGAGAAEGTASGGGTTTKSKSAKGGMTVAGVKVDAAAFTAGLSPEQERILGQVTDPTQKAQMKAQMEMQNMQNLMQFLSNITRIMGDISKSIIQNVRS